MLMKIEVDTTTILNAREKEVLKELKESSDIITYCVEHVADFNMVDQIQFMSIMLKFGNELKPLYLRNASKDENKTFVVKL